MNDKERTPEDEKIIELFTSPEHRKLLRELIDMETEEDRRKILKAHQKARKHLQKLIKMESEEYRQSIAEFEREMAKRHGLPPPPWLKDGES